MRIARAKTPDGVVKGRYEDRAIVTDDRNYTVGEDVTLRPPCVPSALYCLGKNYTETIDQMGYERPDEPDFFIKPPNSIHPPNKPVSYPHFTTELTYAGELAAVIGAEARRLEPDEVPDVVRGYTIMNDLDALDQQSVTARKAFDGSAPLGPWLETDVDPRSIAMRTTIAGETRQEANTESMLFDPYDAIAFISQRLTLKPGDVVAFGSPRNPGTVEPGDEMAIEYEGIGTLTNTVTSDD